MSVVFVGEKKGRLCSHERGALKKEILHVTPLSHRGIDFFLLCFDKTRETDQQFFFLLPLHLTLPSSTLKNTNSKLLTITTYSHCLLSLRNNRTLFNYDAIKYICYFRGFRRPMRQNIHILFWSFLSISRQFNRFVYLLFILIRRCFQPVDEDTRGCSVKAGQLNLANQVFIISFGLQLRSFLLADQLGPTSNNRCRTKHFWNNSTATTKVRLHPFLYQPSFIQWMLHTIIPR